jgi:hypothetical protein
VRRETRRPATGSASALLRRDKTVALPEHSDTPIWRDKACSWEEFSTEGGNCTGHDDHFFCNTKTLQTLAETGAGSLGVKYVLLTIAQKPRFFSAAPRKPAFNRFGNKEWTWRH